MSPSVLRVAFAGFALAEQIDKARPVDADQEAEEVPVVLPRPSPPHTLSVSKQPKCRCCGAPSVWHF